MNFDFEIVHPKPWLLLHLGPSHDEWFLPYTHKQHNIWTFEPAYITAQIGVGSYDPGVPWCITTTLNSCIQRWKNQGLRTWGRLQPEAWPKTKWHLTTATARPPITRWPYTQGPRHCSVVGHCQVAAAKPAVPGMKFRSILGLTVVRNFVGHAHLQLGQGDLRFGGTTTDHYCSVRRPDKSYWAYSK